MSASPKFIRKIDEMKLKFMRKHYGEMTYDEVVSLAQQADDFLSTMTVFDPAWKKFREDRQRWWEYAWLLVCEHGSFCPSDPVTTWHNFLIMYPRKQPYVEAGEFRDWLNLHPNLGDVDAEFSCGLPVYLRPDELNAYATLIYQHQVGITGRLVNVEIVEVNYPE